MNAWQTMPNFRPARVAALLVAGLVASTLSTTSSATAAELTIGSKAPPLEIEHWFHDKEPITAFEDDKVYVVEFWATWCGPCVASMPHLREIQERHADDGLVVISVSDEDPATIEKFLDREKDDTTFREITSHYQLTADPDGSMKEAYMRAANQNGIPTAFLVGKTGEIEWIGHPMRIDEPLAKVLADDWDREAYAKEMAEEQKIRTAMRAVATKARAGEFDEAREMLKSLIEEVESPEMRENLERYRGQIDAQQKAYAEQVAKQGMDLAQQQKAIAGLVEMAFLLEAGEKEQAAAILDELIESVKNRRIRRLLERAKERLEPAASPDNGDAAPEAGDE
jgi:thiol-disulfide isomerase/thioredoxin